MNLLVRRVNMRGIAPHVVELKISLKGPFNYYLTAHVYRHYGSKPAWTPEETAVLEQLYPEADRLDILKALPRRSWKSINQNAAIIGLSRYTMKNSSGIHENLAWADVEIMKSEGLDTKTLPWKNPDELLVSEGEGMRFVPFSYKIDSQYR